MNTQQRIWKGRLVTSKEYHKLRAMARVNKIVPPMVIDTGVEETKQSEPVRNVIYNPKTGRYINDTPANRRRIENQATPKIKNPFTGRLVKDTPANRKKISDEFESLRLRNLEYSNKRIYKNEINIELQKIDLSWLSSNELDYIVNEPVTSIKLNKIKSLVNNLINKHEQQFENDLRLKLYKIHNRSLKEHEFLVEYLRPQFIALTLEKLLPEYCYSDKLIIKFIPTSGQSVMITWTLKNSKDFFEKVESELGDISSSTGHGSDVDVTIALQKIKYINIYRVDSDEKRKVVNGAFFKYFNKTPIDLERYQIFHESKIKYDEHCLIYALKMANVENVDNVKGFIKSSFFPKSKLQELCEMLKIKISLTCYYENTKDKYDKFGNEGEIINIGLIDEHYFLNEETKYSGYYVKHYDELNDIENNFNIYKLCKERGYRFSNKDFKMTSYKLIKYLLENDREKHLKLIDKTDIHAQQFYKKMDNNFEDLNYNEYFCVKENEIMGAKGMVDCQNYFFDFETTTDGEKHEPYLCCLDNNVFYGQDCGYQMLEFLRYNHDENSTVRLIAHNLPYDFRFLYKYIKILDGTMNGRKIVYMKTMYKGMTIYFKDSLNIIPLSLKQFGKTFKLEQGKEVMPYDIYTEENINKKYLKIDDVLPFIKEEDKSCFLNNIEKWNLEKNNCYDIIEYSAQYCKIDVQVLTNGYNTFKKWMIDDFAINIDFIPTMASLANRYLTKEGCYDDVVSLGGKPQQFIQGTVVGGRVMTEDNKKILTYDRPVVDFDGVSLYPSSMYRIPGFLKGKPKVLKRFNYCHLKDYDGYFIDIQIISVRIKRHFPLLSYIDENSGVRKFTNDCTGKIIRVDKFTLEDLIKFHNIRYKIIRGYYFNEGRNDTINDVIKYCFDKRKEYKKQGNPIEVAYKLLMNAAYGKNLLKEITTETKFVNSRKDFDKYVYRNYNYIERMYELDNDKFYIEKIKPLSQHFNRCHVGTEILSMSKRIMNEVMCLAEDLNIRILYQDTDSMHLFKDELNFLTESFEKVYQRPLVGNDLGQFHSDFEIKGSKSEVYARRSIFLGKKSYIDELVGTGENGEEIVDYHIRMKGIPSSCVKYTAKLHGIDTITLYERLYNGTRIDFDLTENNTKTNFKFDKDFTVRTLEEFTRVLHFP